MKGRLHSYKGMIASCSVGAFTSLNSSSQGTKGSTAHLLCYSLPSVHVAKCSGCEVPVHIPVHILFSSSETMPCLSGTFFFVVVVPGVTFDEQFGEQSKRKLED